MLFTFSNFGGSGLVVGHGSLITAISTVGTPTTVIPSPEAGKLRLVVLSGFMAMIEGQTAGVVVSNESGGDAEVTFYFGSVNLGGPNGGLIPNDSTIPGAEVLNHGAWVLTGENEDLKCELLVGAEVRVFATWLDFDASLFGLARLTISDAALHEVIPAPAADKVHELFLFPGAETPHLFFNPSGEAAKWFVNDGIADRLLAPSSPTSPFEAVFGSQWRYYTLRKGESLKVKFDNAPAPASVLAFAYRIL